MRTVWEVQVIRGWAGSTTSSVATNHDASKVPALADPDPELRSVRPGRAAGGSDWIGLRRNEGYMVAGINQLPLLPGILVALAFLMAIGSAWWREGR